MLFVNQDFRSRMHDMEPELPAASQIGTKTNVQLNE